MAGGHRPTRGAAGSGVPVRLFRFFLTLPVALLAAGSARLLPWWPAVLVAVGEVAAQAVPGGYGLLLLAAALVALSYALRAREWAAAAGPPADSAA